MKPLAIDLFTGLHGWAEGLVSEGWEVIGFDLEDMCGNFGMPRPDNIKLILQDVLTLDGAQFKDAQLIVASPPCQEYSYMAMPFSRGKQIEKALCGEGDFPENYNGSKHVLELNALFWKCFCLQKEANEAAGRYIPLIVENVKGAQKWVGRSRWNFGSYHLWGDVPALMPITQRAIKGNGGTWFGNDPRDNSIKIPGQNWSRFKQTGEVSPHWNQCGVKQGGTWFNDCTAGSLRNYSSKSPARARASALIAKIPRPLSEHIGRVFYPSEAQTAS